MQKPILPSDTPCIRDKQYEIKIPQQIKSTGKILGAVYAQFGDTQCLVLYNSKQLYFLEIINEEVVKYSSYNLGNINNLVSIIKGYLVITTRDQKLWLFQLKKTEKKKQEAIKNNQTGQTIQEDKSERMLTVESYLKQISYSAYFVRQVAPNMVELFIAAAPSEKAQKVVYIYQFTIKQKVGGLGFTLDKNYKMVSHSRKQLYASKNFYDPSINSILKLKNFSDLNFMVKKLQQQFIYVLPIGKTQQLMLLNKNMELINSQNLNQKKKVKQQLKGYHLQNSIAHLNYLLLQNDEGKLGLFVIEEAFKIKFLGLQSKQYIWRICFNGKLVGVKLDNSSIKVTRQFNRRNVNMVAPIQQLKISENPFDHEKKSVENQTNLSPSQQAKPNQNDIFNNQGIFNVEKQEESVNNATQIESSVKNFEQPPKTQQNQMSPSKKNLGKIQQLQEPKQKLSFKPTKIASRKGIKQIKKQDQKTCQPEETPQVLQNEAKKQQVQKTKQELQNKKVLVPKQREVVEQKIQINQQKQKINNIQVQTKSKNESDSVKQKKKEADGCKQDFRSEDLQGKVLDKIQSKSPQKVVESHQKPENLALDNQRQKTQNVQPEAKNPFLKKFKPSQVGLFNQSIPSVSIGQIFGNKGISTLKQNNLLSIKKQGDQLNQKALSFKTPQKKSQDQSSHVITNPFIVNQKQQPKQLKQQLKTIDKKIQVNLQKQKTQDTIVNAQLAPLSNKDEVNKDEVDKDDAKCCVNFQQTNQSFKNFSEKITNLQNITKKLIDNFPSVQSGLVKQITSSLSKSQKQVSNVDDSVSVKIISSSVQASVNDYFGKKLTPKVNDYFKCIMNDTKRIYDSTLKFYVQKKKQSIISLQNHFQEQEHLVSEMKVVTGEMLASVENVVTEGQQSHAYLLKQWQKNTNMFNSKLNSALQKLDNHDKSSNQRQKIIDTLAQIKQSLIMEEQARNKKQSEMKLEKETKRVKNVKVAKQTQEIKPQKDIKKEKAKQKISSKAQTSMNKKSKKSKIEQQQIAKYRQHAFNMPQYRASSYIYPYPY